MTDRLADRPIDRADVVIVGAGPYGLSIAAHLKALGLRIRIFGRPMRTWREHMPAGMYLKSDGFASSLSDPDGAFTLRQYCEEAGIVYDATRVPVELATFQKYGMAFQQRFAPELDQRDVVHIDIDKADEPNEPDESNKSNGRGYRLRLEDGEAVRADRVILAVGISHFDYIPRELAGLPQHLVTHSARHSNVKEFKGSEVTVIGAGASAIDFAALLHRAGATVQLVTRAPILKFHHPPTDTPRSLWEQIRHPASGLGPGLRSRFYTDAPVAFHHLPERLRLRLVKKHLGATGGYTVRDTVQQNVKLLLGHSLVYAEVRNEKVCMQLSNGTGRVFELATERVIAATGYRPDLRRLEFLSDRIRRKLSAVENTPILSSYFESSLPGLYFTGLIAANSFGPMLRFAFGADFTARRLAERMSKYTRPAAQPKPADESSISAEAEPALETV